MGDYDLREVKDLKRRIFDLEQQLAARDRVAGNLSGGNLLKSEAIDLYPGEQHDFILELLKQAKEKCAPGTRPYDIIESLLAVNEPVGKSNMILERLNRIFRRGYPSTEADIEELRTLGFTYTPSRKHPKLRFHEKYMFVLPSTPGDSRRGALNALSDISKCIATQFKI